MIIFGGHGVGGRKNDIWALNTINWRWREWKIEVGDLPTPRRQHTAVVYGDLMCVFGGWDDHCESLNDVWLLSLCKSKVDFIFFWVVTVLIHSI